MKRQNTESESNTNQKRSRLEEDSDECVLSLFSLASQELHTDINFCRHTVDAPAQNAPVLVSLDAPSVSFVTAPLYQTVLDFSAHTVDSVLDMIIALDSPLINMHLSPLALLRLRQRGYRISITPEQEQFRKLNKHERGFYLTQTNSRTYLPFELRRDYPDGPWKPQEVAFLKIHNVQACQIGGDEEFLIRKTVEVNKWVKSNGCFPTATKGSVKVAPLLSYYFYEDPANDEGYQHICAMAVPLMEISFVHWKIYHVEQYYAAHTPMHKLIRMPEPLPDRPRDIYRPYKRMNKDKTLFFQQELHLWEPTTDEEVIERMKEFSGPEFRDLQWIASLVRFNRYKIECLQAKENDDQYDQKLDQYYKAKLAKAWDIGQHYVDVVERFKTYEFTWSAPKGTLSKLYGRLKLAYTRMAEKAKNRTALGKHKTITIAFSGISDERVFGSLTEEEAKALGPVIIAQSKDGQHRKSFPIALFTLRYEESEDFEMVVNVYLRNHKAAAGTRILSKQPSLVIKEDGSCEGTRRASAIMPFLEFWDKEFASVSSQLAKLQGRCIFCSTTMSRKESLERGSGDICFAKFGITQAGLVLEETHEDDLVANVKLNQDGITNTTQSITEEESTGLLQIQLVDTTVDFHLDAPIIKASQLLQDMLSDCDDDSRSIPLQLPFITKEGLNRLNDHLLGKQTYVVTNLSDIVDDMKTIDFLLIGKECSDLIERIGKSISSAFFGRLDGLFE